MVTFTINIPTPNVSIYTSTMDPMGYNNINLNTSPGIPVKALIACRRTASGSCEGQKPRGRFGDVCEAYRIPGLRERYQW